MKKQTIKSVTSFAVVLMVLSIIPSGAFAIENGTIGTDQTKATNETGSGKMISGMRHGWAGPGGICDPGLSPVENITEENFTEIQTGILSSITERIARLQSMYNNVSEASTPEELQEILLAERQANAEGIGSCKDNGSHGEMYGPYLFKIENLTDENFTDVQTEILDSLQNMTEKLEVMQTQATEAGEDDRAEELGEKITEIQNLHSDVSGASTVAELKEVVFTYLQSQAVNSLEKEIEFLNSRIAEDENTADENLEQRITELTALIADIEGAGSFDELKEIMSSEMKFEKGPMHLNGQGSRLDRPGRQQNNTTNA